MALSEQTVNRHNIKRAEVFAANGLNDLDIRYAHPSFRGYGSSECALCGKKGIKWLFAIRFDAPQGMVALAKVMTGIDRSEEVTIKDVGSKCINDWLDAVPETLEKLEALKRWNAEMGKCKQAMTAKVVEDLCKAAGYDSPKDAYDVYAAVSYQARSRIGRKDRRQLSNNARKILNKRSSRGTVKVWLENLKMLLAAEAAVKAAQGSTQQPAPAQPAEAPQMSADDTALIERGRVAWGNRDVLSAYHRKAFRDMGQRAVRFHGFRSPSQRQFYTDLLSRLEA